ncbi:MAG: ankyrin repeat domain-containing protein [Burkholderiales bacterium]|nr:ankyrin repeat domain-containing protein [Burkholderiales bacterium]
MTSKAIATAMLLLAISAILGCAQTGGSLIRGADADRLLNAIVSDQVGSVRAAVEAGMNPNQPIPAPGYQEGAPLLAIAARAAALDVMRYLISAGANVNFATSVGETPLMLASFFYDEDRERSSSSHERYERAVRLLVDAGASLENEPYNYTPLAYAAYQGHNRVVRFLIERGARVDANAENGISYVPTPLMMAAMQGHRETVQWLLRAGADARIRALHGHTAAELATKYNHTNLAHMLRCAEGAGSGPMLVASRCQ